MRRHFPDLRVSRVTLIPDAVRSGAQPWITLAAFVLLASISVAVSVL